MKKVLRTFNHLKPNLFSTTPFQNPQLVDEENHEAVVVDVVTNDNHPEYTSDGYNIGNVKFRFVKGNKFRPDDSLNWASPLDSNISKYPLINETVLIFYYHNKPYYSRILNITSGVTSQPVFGLNDESQPLESAQEVQANIRISKSVPHKEEQNTKLGKTYTENDVARLRHDEGDIIYEGRFGNSIRFGSASTKVKKTLFESKYDGVPNLLFRVGSIQTSDTKFGLVQENINEDLTSWWMVSDQIVPLKPVTEGNEAHHKSMDKPEKYEGAQLVGASTSAVFNIRQNQYNYIGAEFYNSVGENYYLDIEKNFVSTAGQDYLFVSNGKISLVSKKIYLGSFNNKTEPIPLGKTLTKLLIAMIDAHINNQATHVMTPFGPGILNPSIVAELGKIKMELEKNTILSDDNFVNKTNE